MALYWMIRTHGHLMWAVCSTITGPFRMHGAKKSWRRSGGSLSTLTQGKLNVYFSLTPGQWFHGKIDPERSDLSPDGSKLLYFAIKLNGRTIADTEYGTSWTAISRPPYLTSLVLWPTGYAWGWTHSGGGLFLSDTEIWLSLMKDGKPHPDHLPQGLTVRPQTDYSFGAPYGSIGEMRRARDGWEGVQGWQTEYLPDGRIKTRGPRIDRKQSPHGTQALILTTNTRDYEARESYLVEHSADEKEALTGAEWADWDHRGRLVFARKGKLFTLNAETMGREQPQELIDLTGNTFEALEAPTWAKQW